MRHYLLPPPPTNCNSTAAAAAGGWKNNRTLAAGGGGEFLVGGSPMRRRRKLEYYNYSWTTNMPEIFNNSCRPIIIGCNNRNTKRRRCGHNNSLFVFATILLCLLIGTPETAARRNDHPDREQLRNLLEIDQYYDDDSTITNQRRQLASGSERMTNNNGRLRTSVQCYSCMSKTMGALWEMVGLDRIFMQPQSFTEHCYKPDEHRPAAFLRHCSFTCISMVIEVPFGMGTRAQVRGCYESIFRGGFNESHPAVSVLKRKDFCHRFNLSEILKHRPRFDSLVDVCSCRGQLCNGQKMPASGGSSNSKIVFNTGSMITLINTIAVLSAVLLGRSMLQ